MSNGPNMHGRAQIGQGVPISVIPLEARPPSAEAISVGAKRQNAKRSNSALVILDIRTLDRECFAQCLRSHGIDMEIHAFASLRDWQAQEDLHPTLRGILLNIGGRKMSEPPVMADLKQLAVECPGIPVIVMADNDELDQVLLALENGARGYIPTSVGVGVCVEAIALAMAGGTFVPASSVVAMREVISPNSRSGRPTSGMFTQRQEEVARALRRGKANKIIAYELNLRESTVKVHIRNIMKKLKATNRTEVAYKISELLTD
jgi:DNA-binding NarL/FixJ family response regulator